MAAKVKSKLEVLWQNFEKSGSVQAFLHYHSKKVKPGKAGGKKPAAAKSKR